jgi:hypothetical protein
MWVGTALASQSADESFKVSKALNQLFDRPDARLTVDAVAVVSDHSLASWTQSGRGGRALLKRVGGHWKIVLCGGKELIHVDTLKKAGVPAPDAILISQRLSSSEHKLPIAKRLAYDKFLMEPSTNHSSGH